MASSSATPDREFDRPDAAFAVVFGLYTATMITPITAFLAHGAVSDTGSLAVAVVSIGAALVGLGTVGTARLPGVPEIVGASSRSWLFVLAPLLGTASVLASATLPSVAVGQTTILLVALAGLGAAFVGLVVVAMAQTRYAAWILADASVVATWTAGWPRASRRRLWAVAGALVFVGGVTFVAGALTDRYPVRFVGQILVPIGLVVATAGRAQTYRATERGLEIETPLARRVFPWEAFSGFEATDDGIVLARPEPWYVSVRCALADVEDPEAVLAALDAHLDRRP